MIKNFIGVDNGVSGSIGIISETWVSYQQTPVVKQLNYTKSKQFLNRIDAPKLFEILSKYDPLESFVMIERPMINPGRFKATVSAIRALEATLIVLELLKLPFAYLDSKEWQRALLPSGLEKEELKFASLNVAERLFPNVDLSDFDDADGLLISEFCRRSKSRI